MNISIVRYRFKSEKNSIDGTLYIDGEHVCDTAENLHHHIPSGTYAIELAECPHLKRNIPAIILHKDICRCCEECCLNANKNVAEALVEINAIQYVIQRGIDEGKSVAEYSAEALAVEKTFPAHPKREPLPFCPQIKPGNSAWNTTDGSILVGQYLQPGIVLRSRPIFDVLYERIRKNIKRGSSVTITVTNKL